jgi:hypothetical protein
MLKGNSSFAGNLDIQLAQPADGRQICRLKNDLYSLESWKASDGNRYLWKGMQTYVQETGEWYELVAEPTAENIVKTTSWKKVKSSVINDTNSSNETTYSSEKILNLLGEINKFDIKVVETLPESGVQYTIYLTPQQVTTTTETNTEQQESRIDIYDEYIWVTTVSGGKWEFIGTTKVDISDYYTKTEVDDIIDTIELTPGPRGIGFIPCSWSTYQDIAESVKVTIDDVEYGFLEKFPAYSSSIFRYWLNNIYNWANHNNDVCIYASDYYPYLTSTDPTNYPDDYLGYVEDAMIECAEIFFTQYNAVPIAPWGDYPSITETGIWWGGNLFGKGGPSVLATDNSIGGIKTGYSTTNKNYAVSLDTNGSAYVNVPWDNTAHTHSGGTGISVVGGTGGTSGTVTLSLNTASSTSLGGIKIGYSNNDKNYGISLDSNESAYVNVPWVNTSHSHSGGTGLSVVGPTGGTSGTVTLSLNTATTTSLGGIKVGDNLNIGTDGKLTAKGYTWTTGRTGSNNIMTIDNGQINAAHGFYETSDARKKDIQGELSLDKAYDFIRNCEPILYNLKGSDKTQIGLIAQEVKEFFPEIINEDEEGYLSLDYAKLTVIILRVLKDLIDKK